MTGPDSRQAGDPDEPVFTSWGPDGVSIRCQVCGAVDEIVQDEMPSMAGYGTDTYTRCTRCGSVETTDPIFGWRPKPAPRPPTRNTRDNRRRPLDARPPTRQRHRRRAAGGLFPAKATPTGTADGRGLPATPRPASTRPLRRATAPQPQPT